MSGENDRRYVEQIFTASLAFLPLLLAVITIVITYYDKYSAVSWMEFRLSIVLIFGTTGAVISGATSFLSLLYLRGTQTPVWLLTYLVGLLIFLSVAVTVGLVWVTIH